MGSKFLREMVSAGSSGNFSESRTFPAELNPFREAAQPLMRLPYRIAAVQSTLE